MLFMILFSVLLGLANPASAQSAAIVPLFNRVVEAHGIVGCLTYVIILPLGVFAMAFVGGRYGTYLHAAIQLIGLAMITSNFGMGIWMAHVSDQLDFYHPVIGIMLFSLSWIQAIGGTVHHLLYRKQGERTLIGHLHVQLGVVIISLGMVNGGLGFAFAGDPTRSEDIAYGVVAGVIWVLVVGAVAFREWKRNKSDSSNANTK